MSVASADQSSHSPLAAARTRRRATRSRRHGRRPAVRERAYAGTGWEEWRCCSSATALLYLYLSAGIRMLSTWRQARHDSAVVALEREHGQLEHQHEALGRRGTLEEEARQLGMMKQGEQSYIVSGLPDN